MPFSFIGCFKAQAPAPIRFEEFCAFIVNSNSVEFANTDTGPLCEGTSAVPKTPKPAKEVPTFDGTLIKEPKIVEAIKATTENTEEPTTKEVLSLPLPSLLTAGKFGAVERDESKSKKEKAARVVTFGSNSKKEEAAGKFFSTVNIALDQSHAIGVIAKLCRNNSRSIYLNQDGMFTYTTMDLRLGISLADRVDSCKGKLSLQSTSLVAGQVLQLVELLHSAGIVHKDIRPDSFMFGSQDRLHHMYLTDFGLSKAYWVHSTSDGKGTHIPPKAGYLNGGMTYYLSRNGHKGLEQSRRDDLESIGYMLLQMITGGLPWSCLKPTMDPEDYSSQIGQLKETTPLSVLCRGAPRELEQFMQHCHDLGFAERPNYDKLFNLIHACRPTGVKDYEFEWFDEHDSSDHPRHHGFLEPLSPHLRTGNECQSKERTADLQRPAQPDGLLRKRGSVVSNLMGLTRPMKSTTENTEEPTTKEFLSNEPRIVEALKPTTENAEASTSPAPELLATSQSVEPQAEPVQTTDLVASIPVDNSCDIIDLGQGVFRI